MLPETVHTEGVEEVKTTVSPEVAVGFKVTVLELRFCAPGFGSVMVCAVRLAAEIVKDRVTEVAAAYVPLPAWLATVVHVPAET
jgi:hypothetical protein